MPIKINGLNTGSVTLSASANGGDVTLNLPNANGTVATTSDIAGMTLITSGTLSGGGVVLSSIPATYKDLRLIVRNYKPATDSAQFMLRLNGDSNARYQVAQLETAALNPNQTSLVTSYPQDNVTADGCMTYEFFDYANTSTIKTVRMFTVINNTTTVTLYGVVPNYLGIYNQTAAINSITMLPNSGNFTSGDYLLYGVK